MKVRCAWHKQNFGFELFLEDKEPLEDPGITDTICPECYNIEMKEVADARINKENSLHDLPGVGRA